MTISTQDFGQTPDGGQVTRYLLTNGSGNTVAMMNYGAIILSVEVPDRIGKRANINLGFPSLDSYLERHSYLGSTVGRFCNRIAEGKFELDGESYTLVTNNGPNHLHGGTVGFDKLLWDAELIETPGESGVRFTTQSPDGQEGYPGTLDLVAEYRWNDGNELSYTFQATTDKSTVLNLTNHAYWNLGGVGSGNVFDHRVQLNCETSLDVDDTLIPTGKIISVEDTPLDFREPTRIGDRIDQLPVTKGYDHCFVIEGSPGDLRSAGSVLDVTSGRKMEILTTQPGVQLYTGNHLHGDHTPYSGLCLETQHFPDSPNQERFPTTRLNPGEQFEQTTVHRFSVVKSG